MEKSKAWETDPEYEKEYLLRKQKCRDYYQFLKKPGSANMISTFDSIMAFNENYTKNKTMGDDFLQ